MYVIVLRNGIYAMYIHTRDTHTCKYAGAPRWKEKRFGEIPGRNANASCICSSREGKVREGKGKEGGGCDLGVRLKREQHKKRRVVSLADEIVIIRDTHHRHHHQYAGMGWKRKKSHTETLVWCRCVRTDDTHTHHIRKLRKAAPHGQKGRAQKRLKFDFVHGETNPSAFVPAGTVSLSLPCSPLPGRTRAHSHTCISHVCGLVCAAARGRASESAGSAYRYKQASRNE